MTAETDVEAYTACTVTPVADVTPAKLQSICVTLARGMRAELEPAHIVPDDAAVALYAIEGDPEAPSRREPTTVGAVPQWATALEVRISATYRRPA